MDFYHDSIRIIIIIISFIVIGYCIFLLYKDVMSMRNEIKKLKETHNVLNESFENYKSHSHVNTKEMITHDEEDNDENEDNEEYDEEDNEEYDEEENEDEIEYDEDNIDDGERKKKIQMYFNKKIKGDWGSNILDQMFLNSEQLKDLHELQTEIEGKVIEVNENKEENKDLDNLINLELTDSLPDTEIDSSDKEDEELKCTFILKSGKNKGTTCGKNKCKKHNK